MSYSSSKSPLATSTTSSPPHHELATSLRARHLITNSPLHYELATSSRTRHFTTSSPPHHELATSSRTRHLTTNSPLHYELATSLRARHLTTSSPPHHELATSKLEGVGLQLRAHLALVQFDQSALELRRHLPSISRRKDRILAAWEPPDRISAELTTRDLVQSAQMIAKAADKSDRVPVLASF